LTGAEETSLRDAIRDRFPEHEAELTISLGTGMRLSEQYTLAWKNIDFERREINLDRTKNGSPGMIPMNDVVRKAVEEFARRSKSTSRDALVFLIKNPKDWFKPAMGDAKIVNYSWHDNRHTLLSPCDAWRELEGDPATRWTQDDSDECKVCASGRKISPCSCEWLVIRCVCAHHDCDLHADFKGSIRAEKIGGSSLIGFRREPTDARRIQTAKLPQD
jgi:hypothetical protein